MRPPRKLPPRFEPTSPMKYTGRIKVMATDSTKKSLLFSKSVNETMYAEMEQIGTLYDPRGTKDNHVMTTWEEVNDVFAIKHIDGHIFEVVKD